jgi:hypothetical protein
MSPAAKVQDLYPVVHAFLKVSLDSWIELWDSCSVAPIAKRLRAWLMIPMTVPVQANGMTKAATALLKEAKLQATDEKQPSLVDVYAVYLKHKPGECAPSSVCRFVSLFSFSLYTF